MRYDAINFPRRPYHRIELLGFCHRTKTMAATWCQRRVPTKRLPTSSATAQLRRS